MPMYKRTILGRDQLIGAGIRKCEATCVAVEDCCSRRKLQPTVITRRNRCIGSWKKIIIEMNDSTWRQLISRPSTGELKSTRAMDTHYAASPPSMSALPYHRTMMRTMT